MQWSRNAAASQHHLHSKHAAVSWPAQLVRSLRQGAKRSPWHEHHHSTIFQWPLRRLSATGKRQHLARVVRCACSLSRITSSRRGSQPLGALPHGRSLDLSRAAHMLHAFRCMVSQNANNPIQSASSGQIACVVGHHCRHMCASASHHACVRLHAANGVQDHSTTDPMQS